MNYLRTAVLLAGMTALFLAVGFMLGGGDGMVLAFLLALGMNLFAYWRSDKLVLRMYGAREVDRRAAPALYGIVEQLADNAGLPMPRVHIIESDQPNAFATGRNPENAAVAITSGLLKRLDNEEVAGVMAHELAHVKSRDTLIMTVTATIAGAIGMLANFALFFGGRGRDNPLGIVGVLALAILALDGGVRILVDELRHAALHFFRVWALSHKLEHVALLEQRGLPVVLRWPRLELG